MRTITRVAMVAVLALALAACGGGSDDDAADETTTTAADGGATDGGATDGTGDDGGDDGATDAAGLLDEDCRFLLAGAYLNPLASAVPGVDVDFGDSADQLQEIAEAAPEEIQEAMTLLADGFAQMAEVLQDVDMSDPQAFADPAVQEAFAGLEDVFNEEYEAASEVVSDFIADNCSSG